MAKRGNREEDLGSPAPLYRVKCTRTLAEAVTARPPRSAPGVNLFDKRQARAAAPYAEPGQRVHLDALAFDPEARSITWGWGLCINPESSSAPGCLEALDDSTVTMQRGMSSFDFALPNDVITSLPVASEAHASVGAVVVACPGDLTRAQGAVPFRCIDASGRALGTDAYVVGVKRVFARQTDKNENPVVAGVTWDGAAWIPSDIKEVVSCDDGGNGYGACSRAEQHVIAVDVPSASTESGVDSFGTSFSEQVVVQYYATEGIFEHDVRFASDTTTGWVARRASAGRTLTMWFVVRDDRGGVTWDSRQIHVASP